jgi:hypothetical protein
MSDKRSSKATNNEIVKALIVLIQDFYDNQPANDGPADQERYRVTIDESNLVQRISQVLHTHRRQQDRIRDLLDSMQKIAAGA